MGPSIQASDVGFGVHIPFVAMLGLQLQRFENGESDLFLPYKAEHDNSFAVIHGGTLMTVLDVAMASAARSVDPEKGVLTIEMKTSRHQRQFSPSSSMDKVNRRESWLGARWAQAHISLKNRPDIKGQRK
jgi:uncharacterized protein (TIGR00369 family)